MTKGFLPVEDHDLTADQMLRWVKWLASTPGRHPVERHSWNVHGQPFLV